MWTLEFGNGKSNGKALTTLRAKTPTKVPNRTKEPGVENIIFLTTQSSRPPVPITLRPHGNSKKTTISTDNKQKIEGLAVTTINSDVSDINHHKISSGENIAVSHPDKPGLKQPSVEVTTENPKLISTLSQGSLNNKNSLDITTQNYALTSKPSLKSEVSGTLSGFDKHNNDSSYTSGLKMYSPLNFGALKTTEQGTVKQTQTTTGKPTTLFEVFDDSDKSLTISSNSKLDVPQTQETNKPIKPFGTVDDSGSWKSTDDSFLGGIKMYSPPVFNFDALATTTRKSFLDSIPNTFDTFSFPESPNKVTSIDTNSFTVTTANSFDGSTKLTTNNVAPFVSQSGLEVGSSTKKSETEMFILESTTMPQSTKLFEPTKMFITSFTAPDAITFSQDPSTISKITTTSSSELIKPTVSSEVFLSPMGLMTSQPQQGVTLGVSSTAGSDFQSNLEQNKEFLENKFTITTDKDHPVKENIGVTVTEPTAVESSIVMTSSTLPYSTKRRPTAPDSLPEDQSSFTPVDQVKFEETTELLVDTHPDKNVTLSSTPEVTDEYGMLETLQLVTDKTVRIGKSSVPIRFSTLPSDEDMQDMQDMQTTVSLDILGNIENGTDEDEVDEHNSKKLVTATTRLNLLSSKQEYLSTETTESGEGEWSIENESKTFKGTSTKAEKIEKHKHFHGFFKFGHHTKTTLSPVTTEETSIASISDDNVDLENGFLLGNMTEYSARETDKPAPTKGMVITEPSKGGKISQVTTKSEMSSQSSESSIQENSSANTMLLSEVWENSVPGSSNFEDLHSIPKSGLKSSKFTEEINANSIKITETSEQEMSSTVQAVSLDLTGSSLKDFSGSEVSNIPSSGIGTVPISDSSVEFTESWNAGDLSDKESTIITDFGTTTEVKGLSDADKANQMESLKTFISGGKESTEMSVMRLKDKGTSEYVLLKNVENTTESEDLGTPDKVIFTSPASKTKTRTTGSASDESNQNKEVTVLESSTDESTYQLTTSTNKEVTETTNTESIFLETSTDNRATLQDENLLSTSVILDTTDNNMWKYSSGGFGSLVNKISETTQDLFLKLSATTESEDMMPPHLKITPVMSSSLGSVSSNTENAMSSTENRELVISSEDFTTNLTPLNSVEVQLTTETFENTATTTIESPTSKESEYFLGSATTKITSEAPSNITGVPNHPHVLGENSTLSEPGVTIEEVLTESGFESTEQLSSIGSVESTFLNSKVTAEFSQTTKGIETSKENPVSQDQVETTTFTSSTLGNFENGFTTHVQPTASEFASSNYQNTFTTTKPEDLTKQGTSESKQGHWSSAEIAESTTLNDVTKLRTEIVSSIETLSTNLEDRVSEELKSQSNEISTSGSSAVFISSESSIRKTESTKGLVSISSAQKQSHATGETGATIGSVSENTVDMIAAIDNDLKIFNQSTVPAKDIPQIMHEAISSAEAKDGLTESSLSSETLVSTTSSVSTASPLETTQKFVSGANTDLSHTVTQSSTSISSSQEHGYSNIDLNSLNGLSSLSALESTESVTTVRNIVLESSENVSAAGQPDSTNYSGTQTVPNNYSYRPGTETIKPTNEVSTGYVSERLQEDITTKTESQQQSTSEQKTTLHKTHDSVMTDLANRTISLVSITQLDNESTTKSVTSSSKGGNVDHTIFGVSTTRHDEITHKEVFVSPNVKQEIVLETFMSSTTKNTLKAKEKIKGLEHLSHSTTDAVPISSHTVTTQPTITVTDEGNKGLTGSEHHKMTASTSSPSPKVEDYDKQDFAVLKKVSEFDELSTLGHRHGKHRKHKTVSTQTPYRGETVTSPDEEEDTNFMTVVSPKHESTTNGELIVDDFNSMIWNTDSTTHNAENSEQHTENSVDYKTSITSSANLEASNLNQNTGNTNILDQTTSSLSILSTSLSSSTTITRTQQILSSNPPDIATESDKTDNSKDTVLTTVESTSVITLSPQIELQSSQVDDFTIVKPVNNFLHETVTAEFHDVDDIINESLKGYNWTLSTESADIQTNINIDAIVNEVLEGSSSSSTSSSDLTEVTESAENNSININSSQKEEGMTQVGYSNYELAQSTLSGSLEQGVQKNTEEHSGSNAPNGVTNASVSETSESNLESSETTNSATESDTSFSTTVEGTVSLESSPSKETEELASKESQVISTSAGVDQTTLPNHSISLSQKGSTLAESNKDLQSTVEILDSAILNFDFTSTAVASTIEASSLGTTDVSTFTSSVSGLPTEELPSRTSESNLERSEITYSVTSSDTSSSITLEGNGSLMSPTTQEEGAHTSNESQVSSTSAGVAQTESETVSESTANKNLQTSLENVGNQNAEIVNTSTLTSIAGTAQEYTSTTGTESSTLASSTSPISNEFASTTYTNGGKTTNVIAQIDEALEIFKSTTSPPKSLIEIGHDALNQTKDGSVSTKLPDQVDSSVTESTVTFSVLNKETSEITTEHLVTSSVESDTNKSKEETQANSETKPSSQISTLSGNTNNNMQSTTIIALSNQTVEGDTSSDQTQTGKEINSSSMASKNLESTIENVEPGSQNTEIVNSSTLTSIAGTAQEYTSTTGTESSTLASSTSQIFDEFDSTTYTNGGKTTNVIAQIDEALEIFKSTTSPPKSLIEIGHDALNQTKDGSVSTKLPDQVDSSITESTVTFSVLNKENSETKPSSQISTLSGNTNNNLQSTSDQNISSSMADKDLQSSMESPESTVQSSKVSIATSASTNENISLEVSTTSITKENLVSHETDTSLSSNQSGELSSSTTHEHETEASTFGNGVSSLSTFGFSVTSTNENLISNGRTSMTMNVTPTIIDISSDHSSLSKDGNTLTGINQDLQSTVEVLDSAIPHFEFTSAVVTSASEASSLGTSGETDVSHVSNQSVETPLPSSVDHGLGTEVSKMASGVSTFSDLDIPATSNSIIVTTNSDNTTNVIAQIDKALEIFKSTTSPPKNIPHIIHDALVSVEKGMTISDVSSISGSSITDNVQNQTNASEDKASASSHTTSTASSVSSSQFEETSLSTSHDHEIETTTLLNEISVSSIGSSVSIISVNDIHTSMSDISSSDHSLSLSEDGTNLTGTDKNLKSTVESLEATTTSNQDTKTLSTSTSQETKELTSSDKSIEHVSKAPKEQSLNEKTTNVIVQIDKALEIFKSTTDQPKDIPQIMHDSLVSAKIGVSDNSVSASAEETTLVGINKDLNSSPEIIESTVLTSSITSIKHTYNDGTEPTLPLNENTASSIAENVASNTSALIDTSTSRTGGSKTTNMIAQIDKALEIFKSTTNLPKEFIHTNLSAGAKETTVEVSEAESVLTSQIAEEVTTTSDKTVVEESSVSLKQNNGSTQVTSAGDISKETETSAMTVTNKSTTDSNNEASEIFEAAIESAETDLVNEFSVELSLGSPTPSSQMSSEISTLAATLESTLSQNSIELSASSKQNDIGNHSSRPNQEILNATSNPNIESSLVTSEGQTPVSSVSAAQLSTTSELQESAITSAKTDLVTEPSMEHSLGSISVSSEISNITTGEIYQGLEETNVTSVLPNQITEIMQITSTGQTLKQVSELSNIETMTVLNKSNLSGIQLSTDSNNESSEIFEAAIVSAEVDLLPESSNEISSRSITPSLEVANTTARSMESSVSSQQTDMKLISSQKNQEATMDSVPQTTELDMTEHLNVSASDHINSISNTDQNRDPDKPGVITEVPNLNQATSSIESQTSISKSQEQKVTSSVPIASSKSISVESSELTVPNNITNSVTQLSVSETSSFGSSVLSENANTTESSVTSSSGNTTNMTTEVTPTDIVGASTHSTKEITEIDHITLESANTVMLHLSTGILESTYTPSDMSKDNEEIKVFSTQSSPSSEESTNVIAQIDKALEIFKSTTSPPKEINDIIQDALAVAENRISTEPSGDIESTSVTISNNNSETTNHTSQSNERKHTSEKTTTLSRVSESFHTTEVVKNTTLGSTRKTVAVMTGVVNDLEIFITSTELGSLNTDDFVEVTKLNFGFTTKSNLLSEQNTASGNTNVTVETSSLGHPDTEQQNNVNEESTVLSSSTKTITGSKKESVQTISTKSELNEDLHVPLSVVSHEDITTENVPTTPVVESSSNQDEEHGYTLQTSETHDMLTDQTSGPDSSGETQSNTENIETESISEQSVESSNDEHQTNEGATDDESQTTSMHEEETTWEMTETSSSTKLNSEETTISDYSVFEPILLSTSSNEDRETQSTKSINMLEDETTLEATTSSFGTATEAVWATSKSRTTLENKDDFAESIINANIDLLTSSQDNTETNTDALVHDMYFLTEATSGQMFMGEKVTSYERNLMSSTSATDFDEVEGTTPMSYDDLVNKINALSHLIEELSTTTEDSSTTSTTETSSMGSSSVSIKEFNSTNNSGSTSFVSSTSTSTSNIGNSASSTVHTGSTESGSGTEPYTTESGKTVSSKHSLNMTDHLDVFGKNGTKSLKNAWNKMIHKMKHIGHTNASSDIPLSVTTTKPHDNKTPLYSSIAAMILNDTFGEGATISTVVENTTIKGVQHEQETSLHSSIKDNLTSSTAKSVISNPGTSLEDLISQSLLLTPIGLFTGIDVGSSSSSSTKAESGSSRSDLMTESNTSIKSSSESTVFKEISSVVPSTETTTHLNDLTSSNATSSSGLGGTKGLPINIKLLLDGVSTENKPGFSFGTTFPTLSSFGEKQVFIPTFIAPSTLIEESQNLNMHHLSTKTEEMDTNQSTSTTVTTKNDSSVTVDSTTGSLSTKASELFLNESTSKEDKTKVSLEMESSVATSISTETESISTQESTKVESTGTGNTITGILSTETMTLSSNQSTTEGKTTKDNITGESTEALGTQSISEEKHILTTLVVPSSFVEESQNINMHHLITKPDETSLKQSATEEESTKEHSSTMESLGISNITTGLSGSIEVSTSRTLTEQETKENLNLHLSIAESTSTGSQSLLEDSHGETTLNISSSELEKTQSTSTQSTEISLSQSTSDTGTTKSSSIVESSETDVTLTSKENKSEEKHILTTLVVPSSFVEESQNLNMHHLSSKTAETGSTVGNPQIELHTTVEPLSVEGTNNETMKTTVSEYTTTEVTLPETNSTTEEINYVTNARIHATEQILTKSTDNSTSESMSTSIRTSEVTGTEFGTLLHLTIDSSSIATGSSTQSTKNETEDNFGSEKASESTVGFTTTLESTAKRKSSTEVVYVDNVSRTSPSQSVQETTASSLHSTEIGSFNILESSTSSVTNTFSSNLTTTISSKLPSSLTASTTTSKFSSATLETTAGVGLTETLIKPPPKGLRKFFKHKSTTMAYASKIANETAGLLGTTRSSVQTPPTTETIYVVSGETCKYTPVDKSKISGDNMTTIVTRTYKPVYIDLPTHWPNSTWPMPNFEQYYPTEYDDSQDDERSDQTVNPFAFRSMKFVDFFNVTEFALTTDASLVSAVTMQTRTTMTTSTSGHVQLTTETQAMTTQEGSTKDRTTIYSTRVTNSSTIEDTTTSTQSTTSTTHETPSTTQETSSTTYEPPSTTHEITSTPESTTTTSTTTVTDALTSTTFTTLSTLTPNLSKVGPTTNSISLNAQPTLANVLPSNSNPHPAQKTCNIEKSNNNCMCSVDSMVKELQEKSRSNITSALSTMCEVYIPLNSTGIKVGRSVSRLRRSLDDYDMESQFAPKPKREVIASADIKDALSKDIELEDNELHKFGTPGSKIRMICADGKNFSSKDYNIKWTFGKNTPITGSKTLETGSGDLIIDNVEPSDGGNYSCSVTNNQVGMRIFNHALSVITLPIMDINTTILYELNMDCLKEDEELLRVYFNTAIGNMLCGKEHRICLIDIVNCTCINKQKKYLTVALVFHIEDMPVIVPTLNTTQCNVVCQMKIYAKLISVIVNNILVFETQPVVYKHSRDVTLIPSKDISLAAYEITEAPKLIIACSAGYGLLGDKHICAACEKNTYNVGGLAHCIPCPPHHYQPSTGSRSCIRCTSPFQDPACMNMMMLNVRKYKYYAYAALFTAISIILCVFCIRCRRSRKRHRKHKMHKSNVSTDIEMQSNETQERETVTMLSDLKSNPTKKRKRMSRKKRAPPIPMSTDLGISQPPTIATLLANPNALNKRMPPTPPPPDF